ncbi:MAG: recombinase family protein, partial [Sediminibacterium sp.]
IRKNRISTVISYKIDRISRNTDDYSQIRILLKRYGVEIKSTTEFFEDNPAGRFMENIIANVAQFDNDVRAERSIGGMRDAVREGRYVWMAPFGYSNVKINGKATISPNDVAPLVKKAFEEVALNRYPADEIRKKLIVEGLVNPSGNPISRSHFYHILKHELYQGWISKFGERHKGSFEPIVSEELFNQVQHVLSGKHAKYKHYLKESPDFPLKRFITHPSGKMLTGCWSQGRKKKYPYYLMHGENINIRRDTLEGAFKNWLNQFKIDITHIEKLQSLVKVHLEKGINDKKYELEHLQKKAMELKAKQHILIEKNIDGVISNELCKEKIASIDLEIYQINKCISDLPKTTINYSKLLGIIRSILNSPGDVWEKAKIERKIKLQWFYFPHGIEFDGKQSRTTKICRLALLKGHFLPPQSYMAPHRNKKSNTMNLQISLPPLNNTDIESVEFWQGVGEEIKFLASLKET